MRAPHRSTIVREGEIEQASTRTPSAPSTALGDAHWHTTSRTQRGLIDALSMSLDRIG